MEKMKNLQQRLLGGSKRGETATQENMKTAPDDSSSVEHSPTTSLANPEMSSNAESRSGPSKKWKDRIRISGRKKQGSTPPANKTLSTPDDQGTEQSMADTGSGAMQLPDAGFSGSLRSLLPPLELDNTSLADYKNPTINEPTWPQETRRGSQTNNVARTRVAGNNHPPRGFAHHPPVPVNDERSTAPSVQVSHSRYKYRHDGPGDAGTAEQPLKHAPQVVTKLSYAYLSGVHELPGGSTQHHTDVSAKQGAVAAWEKFPAHSGEAVPASKTPRGTPVPRATNPSKGTPVLGAGFRGGRPIAPKPADPKPISVSKPELPLHDTAARPSTASTEELPLSRFPYDSNFAASDEEDGKFDLLTDSTPLTSPLTVPSTTQEKVPAFFLNGDQAETLATPYISHGDKGAPPSKQLGEDTEKLPKGQEDTRSEVSDDVQGSGEDEGGQDTTTPNSVTSDLGIQDKSAGSKLEDQSVQSAPTGFQAVSTLETVQKRQETPDLNPVEDSIRIYLGHFGIMNPDPGMTWSTTLFIKMNGLVNKENELHSLLGQSRILRNKVRAELKEERAKFDMERSNLQQQLDQIQRDRQLKVDQLGQSTQKSQGMEQRIAQLESDLATAKESVKAYEKGYTEVEERQRATSSELQRAYSNVRNLQEQNQHLQENLQDCETAVASLEQSLQLAKENQAAELKAQQVQYQKAYDVAKDDYEHRLAAARLRHEAELQAEFQAKERLVQQHRSQLAGQERQHKADLDIIHREQKALIDQHEKKMTLKDRQVTLAAKEHLEAKKALEFQHTQVMSNLSLQHQNELRDMVEKMASFSNKHRDTVARLKAQHSSDLEERNRQTALLVQKHDKELADKENQMEAMREELNNKIVEINNSTERTISSAQKHDREKIRELNQQVASYHKDRYVPIDDDILRKSFQFLTQEINQLASQLRLPPTIDFDPEFDPTNCLVRNSGRRDWIWPRFVRGLCWEVLLKGFFSLPFGFGALGEEGEGYKALQLKYQILAQGGNIKLQASFRSQNAHEGLGSTIHNDKETNQKRAEEVQELLNAIQSGSKKYDYVTLFQANVDKVARELYSILHHIVNGRLSSSCLQQSTAIAQKVGILALEMGTQRARVTLETCKHGEHPRMEQWMTAEDMGSMRKGTSVDLMVHPCLSRVGDGREDLNKKVIVKGEFVPLS
ncbi:hypothetical protein OQA88_12811 [Cercophora sp. LCS_1]